MNNKVYFQLQKWDNTLYYTLYINNYTEHYLINDFRVMKKTYLKAYYHLNK
jgi:hypothetical protein